ncbi:MAG: 50S ribosomal protein L21 [Candidatus Krumholzibacteria bacterium]|nr:50S ribosomal protein L21 [Candidatus Krumholzibacteria bacterium]
MYAVVNLAGKQFTVRPDGHIRVPHLEAEVGSVIRCDDILLFSDGEQVRIGRPRVDGVTVTAEVIEHGRERKILVFKKKRRKNYRRTRGHRQDFTLLKIREISG